MTIYNVDCQCGICVFKETIKVEFLEDEVAKEIEWKCKNCLELGREFKRKIIVRKITEEELAEQKTQIPVKPDEKRYKIIGGNKIQVDEKGNPIKKERKIYTPKKKKIQEIQPGSGVVEMEE